MHNLIHTSLTKDETVNISVEKQQRQRNQVVTLESKMKEIERKG